jgi:hypothetical protein
VSVHGRGSVVCVSKHRRAYSCRAAWTFRRSSSLIMRSTSVFSIAALLLGCALLPDWSAAAEQAAAKSDPTLVEKLSASYVWKNGMYPNLGLPATASTDELIARVFEMTSFQEGPATAIRLTARSGPLARCSASGPEEDFCFDASRRRAFSPNPATCDGLRDGSPRLRRSANQCA